MSARVLVTGGTGTLGREVVARLSAEGATVRVLSRHERPAAGPEADWAVGDLRAGTGLERALIDADAVVHCATGRGDLESTRNLIDVARRLGEPHLVYISIVGVDRVPLGYYRTKLAAEAMIASSGLPFTILRATQFHNLVRALFRAQRFSPTVAVPARTELQPVAVGEVAARLAELAVAAPAGRVPDFGGPEIRPVSELARVYLRAVSSRRRVLPVTVPGTVGRGLRAGGLLAPDHAAGTERFEDFLAARAASR